MMVILSEQPYSYQKRILFIPDSKQSQLCCDFDVGGSFLDEHSCLTEWQDDSASRKREVTLFSFSTSIFLEPNGICEQSCQ